MLKNISKLASGSAISQLILVSSYPVITRIYSPQEFGQFTLLVTVVLFIAIASTLRLEFALPIELNVKLKSILFNMALKVLIIYIFILFILLFLTYLFNINIELNAFYLLISVFFVSFIRILNYNCISNAEFSIISKSLIIVSIVTVFTQFFFSLEFFNNLNGLEIGYILGLFSGVLYYLKSSEYDINFDKNIRKTRLLFNKYKNFPKYSTSEGLFNALGLSLVVILIYKYYGPINAGLYGLSIKLLSGPSSVIGKSISQIYYNKMGAINLKEKERLTKFFFYSCIYCSVLISLIFYNNVDAIIQYILDEEWWGISLIIKIILPMTIVQFSTAPITPMLSIFKLQKYGLIWNLMLCIVRVLVIVYFGVYDGDFFEMLYVYSYVSISLYAILSFYLLGYYSKENYYKLVIVFSFISLLFIMKINFSYVYFFYLLYFLFVLYTLKEVSTGYAKIKNY